jgi:TPR repeat protein
VTGLRFFDRGQYANTIVYWKPLAEAGDCDAAYRYATLFFLGAGVQQDFERPRDWWSKAANQGQYRALAMLATMYGHSSMTTGSFMRQFTIDCRRGCGVTRDPLQAYEWLRLARDLLPGSLESTRPRLGLEIVALEAELTPDQTTEAERWILA